MLMDRDEEAINWLQRSIAITAGTGRTHAVLAAHCYQRLGRTEEARAALAKTMELPTRFDRGQHRAADQECEPQVYLK